MRLTKTRPLELRGVRTYLITGGVVFGFLLSHVSYGDVICLKNGQRITADRVWEEGHKIRYEKNGNLFGFPKELVEKVEMSQPPPLSEEPVVASRGSGDQFIPIELLDGNVHIGNGDSTHLPNRIVKDGKINFVELSRLEKVARSTPSDQAKREEYRTALVKVIEFQIQHGEQDAAIRHLQQYLLLDPENLEAQLSLASLYLRQGQYARAESVLSQAQIRNDDSPELNLILGTAYYLQEKTDLARRALLRSLQFKFRPEVAQMLKKIEEEDTAENSFKQANSLHFVIKYEGTERNQALGQEILAGLEKSFLELETTLNYSPRESITVILYSDRVFRDITKTPDWVGAINDGKIRLPIKGLSRLDENLRRILKHELTHSFIRMKTGDTCPVWLNEGLAQYMAGESSQTFHLPNEAPSGDERLALSELEGPFVSLPYPLAVGAYRKSLLAVDHLVNTYGISQVQRLLELIAKTRNFEMAMKTLLRKNYVELDTEIQDSAIRR
jgi:tetratricopeptide (TPR) repeat protein